MSRLEEELKNALRREQPPEGFAERVLTRAAKGERARESRAGWLAWLELPSLRWAAAAASLVVVLVAGIQFEQRREQRVEGEKAKQQVMVALRLTASRLQFAQQKIHEMSSTFETELGDRATE